jgi:hypothetical protein
MAKSERQAIVSRSYTRTTQTLASALSCHVMPWLACSARQGQEGVFNHGDGWRGDFFTNIDLCRIVLSKMIPAENYCHFWPGGYTEKQHV